MYVFPSCVLITWSESDPTIVQSLVADLVFDKYMNVERSSDSNCEIERYKSMSFTDTDIEMCPLLF